MLSLRDYLDERGRSHFRDWFEKLSVPAATKVSVGLERLAQGYVAAVKSVGGGVQEYKIDFGPGYRIYFGRDGDDLVILLCGGTKKRQGIDIAEAREAWGEYKRRRKAETLKQVKPRGRV